MHQIGTAVVGAGFIGPVHVEALRRVGVNVVGILGVSDEESDRSAESLGIPRAYRSFDEILADKTAEVVHIATPNRLHYDLARRALQAGKHVMCEKPLAMNTTESAELVDVARSSGLAAGVNYNIRYYPICLELAERVQRGDLGDVFSVCGSYVQDWLLYPTDYNWRVLADEGGELRAVADIGTHWMDLVHSITGLEVEAVCADLATFHPVRRRPKGEVETFKGKTGKPPETEPVEIDTEDYGCIMFRYVGGGRGCLWVTQMTAGRKNCLRFEIAGAKGAAAWESEQPNEVWLGHRDKPNERLLRDPALVSDAVRPYVAFPGGHNEGFPDTFKQCFRSFYDYIRAGDFQAPPIFPTFADGHREIVLCEAIAESRRERKWVTLGGRG